MREIVSDTDASSSHSCSKNPPEQAPEPGFSGKEPYAGFQVLYGRMWNDLKKNYYDEAKLKAITEKEHAFDDKISTLSDLDLALKLLAESASDRYTWYAGPDEIRREYELSKKLSSSGLDIVQGEDGFSIEGISYKSPAYDTRLHEGDKLKCINDIEAAKLSSKQVKELLRGKNGEPVELVAVDQESGQEYQVDLKLAAPVKAEIESRLLEDNVLYLRFPTFVEEGRASQYGNLAKLEAEVMRQLSQSGGKLNGFVLDLRNNFGGDTEEAILFSSLFLKEGLTVTRLKPREGMQERNVLADEKLVFNGKPVSQEVLAFLKTTPLVVLSNGSSASSSELVIGALKDNKRAVIVGETTYGKGVGFKVLLTPQGGNMSVTNLKYLTPNNYDLNGVGIHPDIKLARSPGSDDNQLEAALVELKKLREKELEGRDGKGY